MRVRLLGVAWLCCALLAVSATALGVFLTHQGHILLDVIGKRDYADLRDWRLKVAPEQVASAYQASLRGEFMEAHQLLSEAVAIQQDRALQLFGLAVLSTAMAIGTFVWRRHLMTKDGPSNSIKALARAMLVADLAIEDVSRLVAHSLKSHRLAEESIACAVKRRSRPTRDEIEELEDRLVMIQDEWRRIQLEELEDSLATLRSALEELKEGVET